MSVTGVCLQDPRENDGILGRELVFLPITSLLPPPAAYAPRHRNTIIRAARRIKRYGATDAITVRPLTKEGETRYEIVSGELYWRAACLSGIDRLPCIILPYQAQKQAENALFSRIQGGNLHYFDQAEAFSRLINEFGLAQGEVAVRLGVSQSTVANKLRLLRYSEQERAVLRKHGLSERHARTLLRLRTPDLRAHAIEIASARAMSVAATEQLVESLLQKARKMGGDGVSADDVATLPTPSKSTDFAPNSPQNGQNVPQARASATVIHKIEPRSSTPGKLVLSSLQPLYNSIEHTLSIFRKTGREVEMTHEEGPFGVTITIRIPPKG